MEFARLLIHFAFIFHISKCYFVSKTYKIVAGKTFLENVLEEGVFKHYIDCINHCLDTYRCKSIAWNSKNKICLLARIDITFTSAVKKHMVSDIDWVAYAQIRFQVRQWTLSLSLPPLISLHACISSIRLKFALPEILFQKTPYQPYFSFPLKSTCNPALEKIIS